MVFLLVIIEYIYVYEVIDPNAFIDGSMTTLMILKDYRNDSNQSKSKNKGYIANFSTKCLFIHLHIVEMTCYHVYPTREDKNAANSPNDLDSIAKISSYPP